MLQANAKKREFVRLLAQKRFGNYSQASWKRHRKTAEPHPLPAYRNELAATERELLEEFGDRAEQLTVANGAYLDLFTLVARVLSSYIEAHRIIIPADRPLRLKITHDGRSILSMKNVALMTAFCDVPLPHLSQAHLHTFAIFDGKETADNLSLVFSEINLNATLERIANETFEAAGMRVRVEVFLILDWISAVPTLGFARPNTRAGSDQVCGWCWVDKAHLKAGWLAAPWEDYPVQDGKQVALLPSLHIQQCRYDPMHGCKCLLDNVLKDFFPLHQQPARFTAVMKSANPNWEPTKNLRPTDMKEFYVRNLHLTLANTFHDDPIPVRTPAGNRNVPTRRLVHFVLDAIRVYKDFSYHRQPAPGDLAALLGAREALLVFFASVTLKLAPTSHYMTSHFIEFARKDTDVFWMLQEGAEHANRDDKVDVRTTFGRGKSASAPGGPLKSGWQQLLEQKELRRVLVRQGFGEHPYDLPNFEPPRAYHPVAPVQPLE